MRIRYDYCFVASSRIKHESGVYIEQGELFPFNPEDRGHQLLWESGRLQVRIRPNALDKLTPVPPAPPEPEVSEEVEEEEDLELEEEEVLEPEEE